MGLSTMTGRLDLHGEGPHPLTPHPAKASPTASTSTPHPANPVLQSSSMPFTTLEAVEIGLPPTPSTRQIFVHLDDSDNDDIDSDGEIEPYIGTC